MTLLIDILLVLAGLSVVATLGWSVLREAEKLDETSMKLEQLTRDVEDLATLTIELLDILDEVTDSSEDAEQYEERWRKIGVLRAGGLRYEVRNIERNN